jgi:molecular chaperone GrpE
MSVENSNSEHTKDEALDNQSENSLSDKVGDEQRILEFQDEEDPLKVAQEKYIRLYSDFDNFRKRTQKEKADLINYASGDVLKDFLSILDDFQRALEANKTNNDLNSVKEGFELMFNKFDSIMKNKGLTEMKCLGEDFNPDFHEAITNIPAGEEMKGKVVDVIQNGYFLKERVVRYAKVVVGQ